MKIECPNCGHEYDRAPETSRRVKAVEALLAEGWTWSNGAWYPPRSDRHEHAQRERDRHHAALWRLLVEHSDVSAHGHEGVAILLHNPADHDLTTFGPNLEDIVGELARHLLEVNEGIEL